MELPASPGAIHSSFHTTTTVFEGLRDYFAAGGARSVETLTAEQRGREFLLRHSLFRSHHTGQVVDPRMTRFTFPPRWRHDVLRGLDYFRSATAPTDGRLVPAIDLVLSRRRPDGRWALPAPHPGAVWFEMERPGRPSRWNTLRALRVLRWWSVDREVPVRGRATPVGGDFGPSPRHPAAGSLET